MVKEKFSLKKLGSIHALHTPKAHPPVFWVSHHSPL